MIFRERHLVWKNITHTFIYIYIIGELNVGLDEDNNEVGVPYAKELFVLFTRAQKYRALYPYQLVAELIQSLNYATNRHETADYNK
jgi:hypothetical protein